MGKAMVKELSRRVMLRSTGLVPDGRLRWAIAGGCCLAGCLLTGCMGPDPVAGRGPTQVVAPTTTAAPTTATVAKTPAVEPAPSALLAAQGTSALLNLEVIAGGVDEDAQTVAGNIRTQVEGKLAGAGFTIGGGAPDVRVDLAVTTELFDQSGDFFLFTGTLKTEVLRVTDGKVLGKTESSVRGERKLGRNAALAALREKLQAEAAPWISRTVTPAKAGLASSSLSVHNTGDKEKDGIYAAMFVDTVKKMKGVVACTLEKHDYEARQALFRMVYVADAFPEGIITRLYATPSLRLQPAVKKNATGKD